HQIICVDDASSNDISDEIRIRYPDIKLLRLKKNVGKSTAISEGLKVAGGEFILLLDADLQNLKYEEIDTAIDKLKNNQDVDMLVFRRILANFFIRLTRGDVLVTEERILK